MTTDYTMHIEGEFGGVNLLQLREIHDQSCGAVVLIHAISGTLFPYRHMLKRIRPDIAVFGFEAMVDENSIQHPLSSVRALARRYVKQAQAIFERFDTQLVGWSFGGCIAYEMAHLVSRDSSRRRRAVTIDTSAFKSRDSDSCERPKPHIEAAPSGSKEAVIAERHFQLESAHLAALASYVPSPRGFSDLLIVEAAGDNIEWTEGLVDYTASTRVRISGDHYSIIEEPVVHRLASIIEDWFPGNSEAGMNFSEKRTNG